MKPKKTVINQKGVIMNKKHIKFILLFTIVLITLFITGHILLNLTYKNAINNLSIGNYDSAISKLEIVKVFKTNTVVKDKLEIAKYEKEVVPTVKKFFNDLEEAYPKIKTASSVKEVEIYCNSLKSIIKEFEALELKEGSEVSDFISKIRNDSLYTHLKDDYILGNKLSSINYTFGVSSLVASMAVYTATEIPSGCIESILEYELPQQIANVDLN